VTAVKNSARLGRRVAAARWTSGAVAIAAALGLVVSGLPTSGATAATPSSLTVRWVGDSSSAAANQPPRSETSVHFSQFRNLSVTVSQTADLADQSIRVAVAGFAPTQSSSSFGTNARNFIQAMQCWGPDPLAPDFRETCQWGGRYFSANNGVGDSVFVDNTMRVSSLDIAPGTPGAADRDVPFRTIDGREFSGLLTNDDLDSDGQLETRYPILDIFGPATTNEVTSARVGADGTGFFDFEVQSADQAPHMGCGTAEARRCWLVIVPRGSVFSGKPSEATPDSASGACSQYLPLNRFEPYPFGFSGADQGGSPLNPACDYWDNRIVVPLDFRPTGASCELGSAEQRVIGSELMVSAMSSWQPDLCSALKTTFSFATNPDRLARVRLLEGQASVAYSGYPLSSGELETEVERQLLADTDFAYAPVAISGVAIAFLSELPDGRVENLTLSPRLLAKLLTQSYRFTVPVSTGDPQRNVAHLPAVNRTYFYLNQDPEFQALNPTNFSQFTQNPALLLPGPGGADAFRQVWRWLQSDAAAVAFLNGEPDPYGMTVNPYYLPLGHPNATVPEADDLGRWIGADGQVVASVADARRKPVGLSNIDGSPLSLATAPIDTFLKADRSQVVLQVGVLPGGGPRYARFDTLQFAPYVESMLSGSRAAFRAEPNSRTIWDPSAINAAGEVGDWRSTGAQLPGQKFMLVITDSASALRYGLSLAKLQGEGDDAAISFSSASLSAALSALRPTNVATVKQVDPAAVSGAGYPLAIITYAAVNLTEAPAAERAVLASMIRRVTTSGQTPGTGSGQLPPGYLPLTPSLLAEATAAATLVERYPNVGTSSTPPPVPPLPAFNDAGDPVDSDPTPEESEAEELTEAVGEGPAAEPIARSALAVALFGGLAGVFGAPLLMRGRLT